MKPRPLKSQTAIGRAFSKLDLIHAAMVRSYAPGGDDDSGNKHLGRAIDAAEKIISMPAKNAGDMLLKIAAAGVLDDSYGRDVSLTDWQADLSGGICDHAAAKLLMTLRNDLNRLLVTETRS